MSSNCLMTSNNWRNNVIQGVTRLMRLLCGDWGSPRAFLFGPPNQMEKNTRYDIYRLCNLYEKYMCEMCFHHRIIIMRTLVFLSCSFSSSSSSSPSSSSSSPVAPRFFGRSTLPCLLPRFSAASSSSSPDRSRASLARSLTRLRVCAFPACAHLN